VDESLAAQSRVSHRSASARRVQQSRTRIYSLGSLYYLSIIQVRFHHPPWAIIADAISRSTLDFLHHHRSAVTMSEISGSSMSTSTSTSDSDKSEKGVAKKGTRPGRALPSLEEYQRIEKTYYDGLTASRVSKALISDALYKEIRAVLLSPSCTQYGTAQFRYWVRKMFRYRIVDEEVIVVHENMPVATKENIYDILCKCHADTGHGGRDRTNSEIRKHYTWIPKEIVAQFVAACPTCYEDRFAPASTRKLVKSSRKVTKIIKSDCTIAVTDLEASPIKKEVVIKQEPRRPLADLPLNTTGFHPQVQVSSQPPAVRQQVINSPWLDRESENRHPLANASQPLPHPIHGPARAMHRELADQEMVGSLPGALRHLPGETLFLRHEDGSVRPVRYPGCGQNAYGADVGAVTLPPFNPVSHAPTPLQDLNAVLGLGIRSAETGGVRLHQPIYVNAPPSPVKFHPGLKMSDPLGFARPHCPSPTSGTPILGENGNRLPRQSPRSSIDSQPSPCLSAAPEATPPPISYPVWRANKRKRMGLTDLLDDQGMWRISNKTPSPKRQRVEFKLPREHSDHSLTSCSSKSSQSSESHPNSFEDMHMQWDWEPAYPAPSLRDYAYNSVRASQVSKGTTMEKPLSLLTFNDGYEKDFGYDLSPSQCSYDA
jgi:hypothetical protein